MVFKHWISRPCFHLFVQIHCSLLGHLDYIALQNQTLFKSYKAIHLRGYHDNQVMHFTGKNYPEPQLCYLTLGFATRYEPLMLHSAIKCDTLGHWHRPGVYLNYISSVICPTELFCKESKPTVSPSWTWLPSLLLSLALQHDLLKTLIVTLWLLARWYRQNQRAIMSKLCVLENSFIFLYGSLNLSKSSRSHYVLLPLSFH